MKKIISIFASLSVLIACTSCGNSSGNVQPEDNANPSVSVSSSENDSSADTAESENIYDRWNKKLRRWYSPQFICSGTVQCVKMITEVSSLQTDFLQAANGLILWTVFRRKLLLPKRAYPIFTDRMTSTA